MTRSEIYNWLVMAFSEPMNNVAETFYYDRRDREEFVQNIDEEKVLNVLQQRIKNQDGSQRFDFYFGPEASDTMIQEWQELKYLRLIPIINQFIERNEIDLEASRVWDVGGNFSIDLSLKQ